jgi:alkylhydroperoxidase family enzyme
MPHPMRVAPVDHAALSPRQQHVSVKMGRFGTADAANLMKTALNYPEFARAIGRISTRVTLTTDLPPRLWQLACLRTVWLCGSEYLWARHRDEALALGIGEDELLKVARGSGLTGLDALVVQAVDEMHWTHYLGADSWVGFDQFGHNAVMDLMTTYAFYVTLSAFANSAGVQLDEGLAGYSDALRALKPATSALKALREYSKRVEEADYSKLTPAQLEQTGRMGRRGLPTTSKLQKAMINYPTFLAAMAPFGKRAIDDTCLPTRVWQLACMRTVWLCDSEYLWSQHRKACLLIGVTDEDLQGVAEGPKSDLLKGFDKVVVSAIDELYFDNRLSDATWGQFDQFGTEGVTDLILVYGLYVLQSCVARNFGTTLEPNTSGYLPELESLRVNQQR